MRRSALLGGDGGVKLRPVAQQCVRLLYRQRSGFTALGLGLAVESRHLGAAFGNFAIVARIQMLACCGTGDRSCRGNGWHIGLGSKTPGIGALISRYRGGTRYRRKRPCGSGCSDTTSSSIAPVRRQSDHSHLPEPIWWYQRLSDLWRSGGTALTLCARETSAAQPRRD